MTLGVVLSIVAAALGLLGSGILAYSLNSILGMLETAWTAHDITIAQLLSRGDVPHFVGMDKQLDHSRRSASHRTTLGLFMLVGAFGCPLASIFFSLTAP